MNDIYSKARREGTRAFRRAVLEGKYPYVAALDEIIDTESMHTSPVFNAVVPLSQICGTKTAARKNAFACNFMPLMENGTEFAAKWVSLYNHQTEEGVDDPLLLYEYRHRFYVQEGNKRVSVFRFLEIPTVQAEIRRIIPAEEDEAYAEFLTFYKNVPLYEPFFTEPGKYRQLVKLTGKKWGEKWDEEAVMALRSRWYRFAADFRTEGTTDEELSEAFLLYISVYGYERLRTETDASIRKNSYLLKKELKARKNDDKVSLVETPPPAEENVLKKVLPVIPAIRPQKLTAAFIYDASAMESSQVFEHETGRIILEHESRSVLETMKYENCRTPEEAEKALADASEKADVIFMTAPQYAEETLHSALLHPEVKYLCCTLNRKVSAVRSYALKMYETDFLMGILAALLSDNHRAAYIAGVPVYGAVSQINAFAIGAAMIDPEFRICLDWRSVLDSSWKEQMSSLGIRTFCVADTLSENHDSTEYGLFLLETDGSVRNIAAPVISWDKYYRTMIRLIREGSWNHQAGNRFINYWWGMNAGVLDLRISGSLPYQSAKMISMVRKGLIDGRLDPFEGELHSQEGIVQKASEGRLRPEDIIAMDWLCDNIIGTVPPYLSLKQEAKSLAETDGVPKARPKGDES